jgi:hypothetical protein
MSYLQKAAVLSLLVNGLLAAEVKSQSASFYEAIAKTQQQKYTEASDSLETLGQKFLGYYGGAGINGILDTVVVPKLRDNETVEQLCEITGGERKGQGALAIASYDAKLEKFTRIRQAWYTDLKSKRILPTDPKQVRCKTIEET